MGSCSWVEEIGLSSKYRMAKWVQKSLGGNIKSKGNSSQTDLTEFFLKAARRSDVTWRVVGKEEPSLSRVLSWEGGEFS